MPAASTPSTVASFSCSWKYGTGALTSILTPRPWPAAAILGLPRLSLGPAASPRLLRQRDAAVGVVLGSHSTLTHPGWRRAWQRSPAPKGGEPCALVTAGSPQ